MVFLPRQFPSTPNQNLVLHDGKEIKFHGTSPDIWLYIKHSDVGKISCINTNAWLGSLCKTFNSKGFISIIQTGSRSSPDESQHLLQKSFWKGENHLNNASFEREKYEESRKNGKTLKITPLLGLCAIPAIHVCDLLVCALERERERYDYKKQTMSTPVETGTS